MMNFCQFKPLLLIQLILLCAKVGKGQNNTTLPIVIYRGFDSSCCNGTSLRLVEQINATFGSNVPIHLVQLSPDAERDRLNSVFGNADDQVWLVASQLRADERLRQGFIGIGVSQGGVLLRAYVERFNNPPCRRLITLGSPHAGLYTAPSCDNFNYAADMKRILPGHFIPFAPHWLFHLDKLQCKTIRKALLKAANSRLFQEFVLPAQYYRNASFLADINNWNEKKNETYRRNLESLEVMVLYKFDHDQTVIPSDSAWFSLQPNKTKARTTISMREVNQLGLEKLNSTGRLILRSLPGKHLEIPNNFVASQLLSFLNGTLPYK